MLNIGDTAPDFTLPTEAGDVTLSSFRGQTTILYFYPKDNTSGCTQQACDFRDAYEKLLKKAVLIGVSKDSLKSHKGFREKYQLPFPLAADTQGTVCADYGVWVEKSMYGRKYFGIERTTFLIDGEGKIQHIWRKVSVPGHVNDVLKILT